MHDYEMHHSNYVMETHNGLVDAVDGGLPGLGVNNVIVDGAVVFLEVLNAGSGINVPYELGVSRAPQIIVPENRKDS